jgi:hypothetical protein
MESNIFERFIYFVRESYTKRFSHCFSGILCGFIGARGLLFSGAMSELVGVGWWILKGLGAVVLAFTTSLATGYAGLVIERMKRKRKDY